MTTPQAGKCFDSTRHLRTRAQSGNAVFVVLMAISLLTAVGMYSMRAASLTNLALGYNRQSTQAGYIAEFAARSVAAEFAGNEQHYYQYIATGTDDCRANREYKALTGARGTCYKLQSSEMQGRFAAHFSSSVTLNNAPFLLGTLSDSGVQGAFVVEFTDLARAGTPIAGEDVGADHFKHMQVLLTATAQVRPDFAGVEQSVCNDAISITSGLSNLKAQLTFGPVH
jgi:hypothetical protein